MRYQINPAREGREPVVPGNDTGDQLVMVTFFLLP
jgi:hypothetical protein